MSERAINAVLVLLAVLALAAFVAIGGDGDELDRHAQWMGETREAGTCVMW